MKQKNAEYSVKSRKVLTIIVCWLLIGVVITLYDHLILLAGFAAGHSPVYTFWKSLLFNITIALIAAVFGGTFLVFFINEKFRDKSYLKSTIMVVGSFIAITSVLIVSVTLVQSWMRAGSAMSWSTIKASLMDAMHLKNVLVWSIIVALTQLGMHINDKFGRGMLLNLVLGRYHQPREETRIFMVVDLLSSTTIAEKLDNETYHRLLRDFFADITNAIVYNRGEIYQYVGDEIVISWRLREKTIDNRCLQCYFDMRSIISELGSKYKSKYGIVPDFKAGLHYGQVMAGEIGIIKKDITYSGDVLNTTSRIQGKCNEYKVKILSSDTLLNLLPYGDYFNRIPIGEIELRGKQSKVSLSTLELRTAT